jgi:hypothetical protein
MCDNWQATIMGCGGIKPACGNDTRGLDLMSTIYFYTF